MKRYIAWDTSSKSGALVAAEWDPSDKKSSGPVLVHELSLDVNAQHSERLLWAIDQLLEKSGWKLQDVDFFGVGLGPGSFTGLRIGITTAKTLAHVTKKPIVGVSSLACLARGLVENLSDRVNGSFLVAAVTDACKGELFSLVGDSKKVLDCVILADGDTPGSWSRGVIEEVLTPEQVISTMKKKGSGEKKWALIGDAADRYPEIFEELSDSNRIHHDSQATVMPALLGRLVWEAYQFQLIREPLEIKPRYLRASDAEVKRQKANL